MTKNIPQNTAVKYVKPITYLDLNNKRLKRWIVQQGFVVSVIKDREEYKAIVVIGNDRNGLVTCDYVNVEELEILNG